jgi:hypothetical protein
MNLRQIRQAHCKQAQGNDPDVQDDEERMKLKYWDVGRPIFEI